MKIGDKRALARLMTLVDNRGHDAMEALSLIHGKTGRARCIGVTGPPGAGKSTLANLLIGAYRAQGKTVGVVAIDPSSPFTGGAVLGDRIRMMDHGMDEGVFIRSLGSHGAHGGLSRTTRDIVNLMDAFGMEVILIETVGVGQTEIDIMSVAQVTVVVLVPESGDTIQTMKAGLLEIADIFVVNKADRPGADRIFAELKVLSEMNPGKAIPVMKTVATQNKGTEELIRSVHGISRHASLASKKEYLTQECLDILLAELHASLKKELAEGGKWRKSYRALVDEHHNPYKTALEVLEKISIK